MRICWLLVEGLTLFAGCLVIHALLWRVWRPASFRGWLPALAAIFGPFAFAVGGYSIPVPIDLAAVLLLHLSLSSVYIVGYTLISAFSPSVELLKLLRRSPDGVPLAALRLPFLAGALTGDRIANLEGAGLVAATKGTLTLGPRGRQLTALVLLYRHVIGLRDGGGG